MMRMITALQKESQAAHSSHLDLQRTLQRVFRRAELPLRYSSGFNPHPLMSFATALATGHTSDGEWFEVELEQLLKTEEFLARVNAQMPNGMSLQAAFPASEGMPSLAKLLRAAGYRIALYTDTAVPLSQAEEALAALLGKEEILVSKKTKGGEKLVDIRPSLLAASLLGADENGMTLSVTGALTAAGGLRAELLAHALLAQLGWEGWTKVHRTSLYFSDFPPLPLANT